MMGFGNKFSLLVRYLSIRIKNTSKTKIEKLVCFADAVAIRENHGRYWRTFFEQNLDIYIYIHVYIHLHKYTGPDALETLLNPTLGTTTERVMRDSRFQFIYIYIYIYICVSEYGYLSAQTL